MNYFNEGNKFYNGKDYEKAIDCYMKAIIQNINIACSYYNIGVCFIKLKKFDDAIETLEKYYAMDTNAKDKASTLYNLATAYEGKGNNAKACGYYKQILTDPTYKQIAEYKVKTELKCN